MVCVLAACHKYGVFTGSVSELWCLYWQHAIKRYVGWQHVICTFCVLAACLRYGVCTGSMSQVWNVYCQRGKSMVCVLAARHIYGVCTGSMP